ncbi:MAG: glycosyltransferase family 25 protein [Burkholderiales bacterium]|nr:glycosyltransferase family 25 protein [Burkholderiales bacterium]
MNSILRFVKNIYILIKLKQYKSLWYKLTFQYRIHNWKQERINVSKFKKLALYKKLIQGGICLEIKSKNVEQLVNLLELPINQNSDIVFTDQLSLLTKKNKLIIFMDNVDADKKEISSLLSKGVIDFVLTNELEHYDNRYVEKIYYYDDKTPNFYIGRLFLAIDLISFKQFMKFCDELDPFALSNKVCLSLPEYPIRYNYIQNLISTTELNKLNFISIIGLRHTIGWIGCGLSYKYLFSKSLQHNYHNITIAEDDIVLEDNFTSNFQFIQEYLSSAKDWDVFNGYTFLDDANNLLPLIKFGNDNCLYATNKFMSTVFNTYNRSLIQRGSEWNEQFRNKVNAIDGYLRAEVYNVIISYPFIVGHNEQLDSVLWNNSNEFIYNNMLVESKKVANSVGNL